MKNIKVLVSTALVLSAIGCTKLDEKLQGSLDGTQVGSSSGGNNAALLKGIYNSMRVSYQGQERVFALGELPSDAAIVPTRGGDWDDNGAWRVLHSHAWDAENQYIRNAYNDLSGTLFAATDFLQFNPTPAQAAEARFLRAFTMFDILDGWDQVAYREPGENTLQPSQVRKGVEALDFIIAEITAILPQLKASGPIGANQDAAKVLLMKCYLNKGAIANRAAPTFAAADMQQVITLADQVINTGKYTLANNYFDNFAPNNGVIGTENIFTAENVGGVEAGGLNSRWHMTMHYNQNPGGWNGFTTLSDFYEKFTPADTRRGVNYPQAGLPNPGNHVNIGFLVGQQYNQTTGAALQDRTGAPLSFTREVNSVETGNNLEITGIRVNKYPIDLANDGSGNVNNDYVYYRISDVMLMKAEAQLRTNAAAAGLTIVNTIRVKRGAAPLASLTLDNLLDERGRELYWENYRRQDLIRFGKFLQPYQLKPTDDPKYLLFTIPNEQLAVNPNLTQNPGY
ncbi:MAG: RagB/SusD family nutrient uptake outer membrane protein [Pedobacter sp.]|nr:MAG: RagB/SusD family nutrient uptake outer membrane protein [Pedobacter sp.]